MKFLQNKIFILILLVLSISFVNLNVGPEKVFLGGEFMYSLDYQGHWDNLVKNYVFHPENFLLSTQCIDCPDFYQFSAWHGFSMVGILGIGELLGLNPFVFRMLLIIISQLFFLYLFVKLNFSKFSLFPFVVSSLIFILIPHKIYLMPAGAIDGLNHGLMIGAIGIFSYIVRNVSSINVKKIINWGLAMGIIISLILSVAISHMPVAAYSLVVLIIYFSSNILQYGRSDNLKLILFGGITLVTTFILNLPFVISQFVNRNLHHITDYSPLSKADALTANMVASGANTLDTYIIFGGIVILLFVAKISSRMKVLIILGYLAIAFFLTGGNIGSISIYGLSFKYLPLMNHMRGVYRFTFWQLGILFIISYLGIIGLQSRKHFLARLTTSIIITSFLFVIINFIHKNNNIFHTTVVPAEYSQLDKYIGSLSGKKIYFPLYGPSGNESMTGNYNWLSERSRNPTLYTNPFTSLYFVNEILSTEGYPLNTSAEGQLRHLVNFKEPNEIINSLEFLGIKYLIVDKNYNWNKNYPTINLDSLTEELDLIWNQGSLFLYQLSDRHKECRPSYGDYLVGYCYRVNPEYLINRTSVDYYLDQAVINRKYNTVDFSDNQKFPNYIVNVPTREEVINLGSLIPFQVYQIDGDKSNIFKHNITAGKFKLLIPVLKLSPASRLFKNSVFEVYIDGNHIKKIFPYSAYHGIVWEKIDIESDKKSQISISATGQGHLVVGNPILMTLDEYRSTEKMANNFQLLSTYGQYVSRNIKINNIDLDPTEIYNQKFETDLLSDKFLIDFDRNIFRRSQSNPENPLELLVVREDSKLKYEIVAGSEFEKLTLNVGSAFVDSELAGRVEIKNDRGMLLYGTTIYKPNTYQVSIDIPPLALNGNKSIAIEFYFKNQGSIIYRLVMEGKVK
jgi:hypothetical protein